MQSRPAETLALLIPAYNEAGAIGSVVRWAATFGAPIVIDDGSEDRTAAIAAEAGALVLHSPGNLGYERALARGYATARDMGFEYCITLDADGQHPPEAVAAMIHRLYRDDRPDVVIGVRRHRQRVAEHVAAYVGTIFWRIGDPFSGLKGYKIAFFDPKAAFDRHAMVGTELLARCLRAHGVVATVAIETLQREGAPKFGSGLRPNLRMFKALLFMLLIRVGVIT